MTRRRTASGAWLVGLAIFALISVGHAETLNYGVDVGVGESDNVTLVSSNKVSQTIATSDLDFLVQEQTRLFNLDAKGYFSYLDYLQGAYGNQLIGRFDGTGRVALVPERLTWSLQDNFGQAALSPFVAPTPNNLEDINYVSTGPDLLLRFMGTGFTDISARYARAQYQTSPFDSNRLLGNIQVGIDLSPRSSVSINVDSEHVSYDNKVVNTDFDQSGTYGRYELHGARTDLILNVGASRVDQGNTAVTGPLVDLNLTRKVSPSTNVTITGGRELTDISSGFSNLQSGAITAISTAPAAVSSAIYRSTYAAAVWRYQHVGTSAAVSERWEQDSYPDAPLLDSRRSQTELTVAEQLTRVLAVQVTSSYYDTRYTHGNFSAENSEFIDKDGLIGAAFIVREGRALEFRLRYDYIARAVSGGGSGYRENRLFLTIGYRPKPSDTLVDPGSMY